jgi:prepilin-type N-terminal cleavage/methylation domain-containing protein
VKALDRVLGGSRKGFTLVELLVAVAIIGVITGTILVRFVGGAGNVEASQSLVTDSQESPLSQTDLEGLQPEIEAMANRMEFQIVQTAMDTMMIRMGITRVEETGETRDMSSFPGNNPLYPRYLRNQTTKCRYACDPSGMISQVK